MDDKTLSLLGDIEFYRKKNNVNWMRILSIALEHAPEETKSVLQQINKLDRCISKALEDIV